MSKFNKEADKDLSVTSVSVEFEFESKPQSPIQTFSKPMSQTKIIIGSQNFISNLLQGKGSLRKSMG